MPDYHWENARQIWRYHNVPRVDPTPRTRECIMCRAQFTPRYRTPLDLREMTVCPPCRVRELEYNVKSRREDDDAFYNPGRGAPPARRRPVKRKTKPKDTKPKTPPKDKRPTAWDRILDPVLSV